MDHASCFLSHHLEYCKDLTIAIGIILYTGLFAVVNGKDAAGLPAIVLKEDSPGFRYGGGDLTDSNDPDFQRLMQDLERGK